MQLLDSLLPMIELVTEAGTDSPTEKYVSIPLNPPKPLFGIFKRGDPPKIYRVRNNKHARGLAERRKFNLMLRDMNSTLTLNLEIGYRVGCIPGKEEEVAELLSAETTPGDVFDQKVEGWINEFARSNSGVFESADIHWGPLSKQLAASAHEVGLALNVFLERLPVTRRTWAFALPVSFRDQTETISVSFRLSVYPSTDEASINRARLNETPAEMEKETKRRIQEWFGEKVLRDTVERQTGRVQTDLKAHLDKWLVPFGMESLVEAIEAPPRSKPEVAHTERVAGVVSLGHFQWQVRTTMEIEKPDLFLQEKKKRQIGEIHIWLGEQYPEFCWDAVRESDGDPSKFATEFEARVKDAVESIGYKLKHSMLRRVLSDVELDARKQHLDSNVAQDKFLNRLIEDTQQKIVNAYNAEDDTDQIEKLEKRLDDLQGRRNTLVEGIAKMRANAKNLLPDATTAAIGAERRTWTAIADGGAEQPDGQKSNAAAAGADGAAAPPTPAPATPAPDAAGPAGE
jgi:hypothetical protein